MGELECAKRLAQLYVPLQCALFGSIQCDEKLGDWVFVFVVSFVTRWEFHVYIFTLIKFFVEKCGVEVKDFNILVVVSGNGEDCVEG